MTSHTDEREERMADEEVIVEEEPMRCGPCADGNHALCDGTYWWEPPPHVNATRRRGSCICEEAEHPGRPVEVEPPPPGPSLAEVQEEEAKAAKEKAAAEAKTSAAQKPDEAKGHSTSSSSRTK